MRVLPEGNAMMDTSDDGNGRKRIERSGGLGAMRRIEDRLILDNVFEYLTYKDMISLASVSRAMRALSCFDPLWKDIFADYFLKRQDCNAGEREIVRLPFSERITSWRQAFLTMLAREKTGNNEMEIVPIEIEGIFYSDAMFRSYACSTGKVHKKWLKGDNVKRVDASMLSVDEFIEKYEKPNIPVLIKNAFNDWDAPYSWIPTLNGKDYSSGDLLKGKANGKIFRVGPFDTTWEDFINYCKYADDDENSLYLFDSQCLAKYPELFEDVNTPLKHFCNGPNYTISKRDLFSTLGDKRPDYMWLIVGKDRSGSCWHIDPNFTNAWNATIHGRKKWIMCPPSNPPPGVYPSPDGAEVLQPVSLYDWFENFYEETKEEMKGMVEFIANPGDLVFVPSRWWHCVLNLDDFTIAVTQNYVSESNLKQSLLFMKNNPDQVSGLPTKELKLHLFNDFSNALAKANIEYDVEDVKRSDDILSKKRELSSIFEKGKESDNSNNIGSSSSNSEAEQASKKQKSQFSFGFTFN